MKLRWTEKGLSDLALLHEVLAGANPPAAAKVVRTLTAAVGRLAQHPRAGEKLEQFEPREVRRIVVGHYEIRYEIQQATVIVLRFWHTREDR